MMRVPSDSLSGGLNKSITDLDLKSSSPKVSVNDYTKSKNFKPRKQFKFCSKLEDSKQLLQLNKQ